MIGDKVATGSAKFLFLVVLLSGVGCNEKDSQPRTEIYEVDIGNNFHIDNLLDGTRVDVGFSIGTREGVKHMILYESIDWGDQDFRLWSVRSFDRYPVDGTISPRGLFISHPVRIPSHPLFVSSVVNWIKFPPDGDYSYQTYWHVENDDGELAVIKSLQFDIKILDGKLQIVDSYEYPRRPVEAKNDRHK